MHRRTEPSGQPAVIWPERRLKILIWHVHGSYLAGLSALDHDWYLPVCADYGGRRVDSPTYVRAVPAAQVRHPDLDLVIYQTNQRLTRL